MSEVQYVKTAVGENDLFIFETPNGKLSPEMIPGVYF
jgi:hypothetical protein